MWRYLQSFGLLFAHITTSALERRHLPGRNSYKRAQKQKAVGQWRTDKETGLVCPPKRALDDIRTDDPAGARRIDPEIQAQYLTLRECWLYDGNEMNRRCKICREKRRDCSCADPVWVRFEENTSSGLSRGKRSGTPLEPLDTNPLPESLADTGSG
eukprot:1172711-Rhodomonas_salina.1